MNYSDFFGKRNRIYKFAGGGPFEDDTYNKSYLDYLAKGMSNRDAAQLVWKDAQLSLSSDPTFDFHSDEGKQRYAQLEALLTQADTILNTSKLTFSPNGDAATFGDRLKGFGQLRVGKTGLLLGQIGVAAMEGMDKALMGDKNFGAASNALDTTVHGVSKTLMSTGNPWAMCCLKDTIIFTAEGKPILILDLKKEDGILGYYNKEIIAQPIEELFPPLYKESILIETEGGNILRCSTDHPIYSALEGRARYVTVSKKKLRRIKEFSFRRADTLKVGDFIAEAGSIPFFGKKHIKLAYLVGLLIGDGTYGKKRSPRLFTGDACTWLYIEANNLGKLTELYLPGTRCLKEFRVYTCYGLNPVLRELGIYGQTKKNKRLPNNIYEWDKESCASLLSGLFDTDGFVLCDSKRHAGIYLSQSNIELLKQVKLLLLKFGIHCTILKFLARDGYIKEKSIHSGESYVLSIKTRESVINFYNNITFNIDYKQEKLLKAYLLKLDTKSRDTSLEFHNVFANKIKRIIKLGYCEVYNLSAGISHTYLADGIVTHNTAAAALEVGNFATKASGATTAGYDVEMANSAYSDSLAHQLSKSSRNWGGLTLGLANIGMDKRMESQLRERNEAATMAILAASVAKEQSFEQEARMNTVQDVLLANLNALNGEMDTSLLIAKKGGKIARMMGYKTKLIEKAKYGRKLQSILVSEAGNILPTGALHAHLNHMDSDEVTKKGIPVVQTGSNKEIKELLENSGDLIQAAEIERDEIIFSKELTDYIESKRENKEDRDVMLEVGKRLTKEILMNTKDESNLIKEVV